MTSRQQSNPLKVRASVPNRSLPTAHCPLPTRSGLTIVEMLVAMAITLLIMAAVVTVFANVSSSVTRRRATIEMSSALRNVRETLARDLAGATCPAVPWQRPESNVGYIEIIEGPQNDYYPSIHLFDGNADGQPDPISSTLPGIDLTLSSLPGSNLGGTALNDFKGNGLTIGSNTPIGPGTSLENTPTDGRGLGDGDDTLMLTVRNEKEPFVGRIPLRVGTQNTPSTSQFAAWRHEEVESPLAEVVWYALENPVDPNRTFAFGEPGFRTIYRRTLLILPDLNYGITITGTTPTVLSGPGVVRVLNLPRANVRGALAALIGFQERYDLSVRLEWDPLLPSTNGPGRWVLKTNTLGDLTKRENRYEHHGYVHGPQDIWRLRGDAAAASDRYFPFAAVTAGSHRVEQNPVFFMRDPELPGTAPTGFQALATPIGGGATTVVAFERAAAGSGGSFAARPFVHINDNSDYPATVRAILNEEGSVVHFTTGMAPLGGARRGEDVMMTDALAFDLRVYDPGAPLYAYYSAGLTRPADVVLQPGDPAWITAYNEDANAAPTTPPGEPLTIGDGAPALPFAYQRQGAYVDLGYGLSYANPTDPNRILNRFRRTVQLPDRWKATVDKGRVFSPFFQDGGIRTATGPVGTSPDPLTRLFATYDTWSWHYENNGVNEDGDDTIGRLLIEGATNGQAAVDEGVNGLDNPSVYHDDTNGDGIAETASIATRYGPDDDGERETRPPYDTALRGLQVSLRAYERDSRQIREVRVKESFVPE